MVESLGFLRIKYNLQRYFVRNHLHNTVPNCGKRGFLRKTNRKNLRFCFF